MKPIVKYACGVCNKVFDEYEDARACSMQPFNATNIRVGDIVAVPGLRRWSKVYNEDWVAFRVPADLESNSHFDHQPWWVPYFVVTSVHSERMNPHRAIVTIASKALGTIWYGWNPADGRRHHAMFGIDGVARDSGSTWRGKLENYLDNLEPSAKLLEEAAELAATGKISRYLI